MNIKSFVLTILSFSFIYCGDLFSQDYFELTNAKEVNNYYISGGYEEEIRGIIEQEKEYFASVEVKEMSAVVFDVDETSLSNFEFDTVQIPFSIERWNEWVRSENGQAIKPVKELYDYLVSLNYRIIFISGRIGELYEPTRNNLIKQGYTVFDTLICRTPEEKNLTAAEYKTAWRKKLTQSGYSIVGNVGDQWSDMSGGNSGHYVRVTNYEYYIK